MTIVLTAVLAACGQTPQNPQTSTEGSEPQPGEENSLRLLQSGTLAGRYGTAYAEDHTILCYLDYANGCDAALCSQPACNHNNDNCTAYIPEGVIVSGLYAVDDQTMA